MKTSSMRKLLDLSVPVAVTDHIVGPTQASVTVVEYGDFECPNCKQAAPAVKLLLAHFTGRVCFVYRHFPLEEVHRHALATAEAAEAASSQGQFWQMHDMLFEEQPRLQPNQLRSYAERLQLNVGRFTEELDGHFHLGSIREHIRGGHKSGVRGTPTFFVNGTIRDVSFGIYSLFDTVEAALRLGGRPSHESSL
jgi:protein-disulfide isomerase